jgi:hypothetical protein
VPLAAHPIDHADGILDFDNHAEVRFYLLTTVASGKRLDQEVTLLDHLPASFALVPSVIAFQRSSPSCIIARRSAGLCRDKAAMEAAAVDADQAAVGRR